jgi:predicted amidohydrolase YtcJ
MSGHRESRRGGQWFEFPPPGAAGQVNRTNTPRREALLAGVSRADPLRMMTIDAAYLSFDEKKKGSIEVGELADLAVLDDDFLGCDEARIKDIKVAATVVGGKVVYEAKR